VLSVQFRRGLDLRAGRGIEITATGSWRCAEIHRYPRDDRVGRTQIAAVEGFEVPELPEVESVRLTLAPSIVGRRVTDVRSFRRDFATTDLGKPASRADLLRDTKIISIERRGKLMWVVGENGRAIGMHLGMSGEMRIVPRGTRLAAPFVGAKSHVHVAWKLDDGTRWLFRDPRRFGGVWCMPSVDVFNKLMLSRLGPDALYVTPDQLAAAIKDSRRPIKAALLDQAVLAGVGNIYADEALFASGINPARHAASVTVREIGKLADAVREVLQRALRAGGSTLRDYRDATGEPGRAQAEHKAYGRAGLACMVCGTTMIGTTLAQRTTVHCPRCQS
jgi:formamidopyrimidine-DNA glycosylase